MDAAGLRPERTGAHIIPCASRDRSKDHERWHSGLSIGTRLGLSMSSSVSMTPGANPPKPPSGGRGFRRRSDMAVPRRRLNRARLLVLLATAVSPLVACARTGPTFSGEVVGVADGDTISVLRDNQPVKVRLDGIDCPELGQAFGAAAKQFTSSLVLSRTVSVAVRDTDQYGRLVGRVYVGRQDVSLELVRAGYAWHYKRYSSDPALTRAEQEARAARRGLWSDARSVPPWEFRAGGSGSGQDVASAERHMRLVSNVNETAQHSLGPSPALAISPFLGLGLLTGAALITDTSWARESSSPLVRGLRSNPLLIEVRGYATWWLFAGLMLLALLGFLFNSGKLQGLVGKPFRVAESVLTMLVFGYLLAAPRAPPVEAAEHLPVFLAQAIPFLGVTGLLAVGFIIVLASMMVVRTAIDVIIWLSPVPFIDLVFEVLKKVLSAAFVVLYLVDPVLAAFVAGLIFLISLVLLRWAGRIVAFAFSVLLNPLFVKVFPPLTPALIDTAWLRRLHFSPGEAILAVPAVALRSRHYRKRTSGVVTRVGANVEFWSSGFLGRRSSTSLAEPGTRLILGRAFLWIELRLVDAKDRSLERFAFSYALLPHFEDLRARLGADDGDHFGALELIRRVLERLGHPSPETALGRTQV
jgi:endonuclease YncB( thermonuclease family)